MALLNVLINPLFLDFRLRNQLKFHRLMMLLSAYDTIYVLIRCVHYQPNLSSTELSICFTSRSFLLNKGLVYTIRQDNYWKLFIVNSTNPFEICSASLNWHWNRHTKFHLDWLRDNLVITLKSLTCLCLLSQRGLYQAGKSSWVLSTSCQSILFRNIYVPIIIITQSISSRPWYFELEQQYLWAAYYYYSHDIEDHQKRRNDTGRRCSSRQQSLFLPTTTLTHFTDHLGCPRDSNRSDGCPSYRHHLQSGLWWQRGPRILKQYLTNVQNLPTW